MVFLATKPDGDINVLDIVTIVNWILTEIPGEEIAQLYPQADMNGDGAVNVLDIVTLTNCVLANNCSDITSGRPELDTPDRYLPPKGMSERVHTKILKELTSGKMNLNQMNRYLRRKIPKKIRGV